MNTKLALVVVLSSVMLAACGKSAPVSQPSPQAQKADQPVPSSKDGKTMGDGYMAPRPTRGARPTL